MRKHLTEVHQHDFNIKEGMFACEKCDKKFRTFDILSKHIKVCNYSNDFYVQLMYSFEKSRAFMNLFTCHATSAQNC